jgi:hypothetical protein
MRGLRRQIKQKPISPPQTPPALPLSGEERSGKRSRAFDVGIHAIVLRGKKF